MAWGDNSDGQSSVPAGLSGVIAIAAGGYHSLALKQDGTVVAWGAGGPGQTTGFHDWGQATVPTGLRGVVAIAGGLDRSLALANPSSVGPSIIAPPPPQVAASGSTAHLYALADGLPPLSFQWFFDGTNALSGGTNAVLELANVRFSQSGLYSVVVTNAFGAATSAPAVLTVVASPSLTTLPTNCIANAGAMVDFAVEAAGTAPLAYQWFFNGTNALAGATNAVLELTNLQAGQSGAYNVVVSNLGGTVASPPAVLTVMAPPSLVTMPSNCITYPGGSVEFAAAAAGAPPLGYQWFFNITNALSGATNAVLDLAGVQSAQLGVYLVVVTNPFGAVTSSPATLALSGPVVVDTTEAALRYALTAGLPVSFACDGTITLTNQIVITNDTVLDGTGHQVTIACTNPTPSDPGNGNRAFYVSSNVTLTAMHLAISNGLAQALDAPDSPGMRGGAILNDGALNLREVSFLGNSARAGGGAVANRNGGTINATNCAFAGNGAGASYGYRGLAPSGGAILNEGGQVSFAACVFQGNSAVAGYDEDGMGPFDAYGGAIHSEGSLTVSACIFQQNSVQGSGGFSVFYPDSGLAGGPGGSGYGGAISSSGSLSISGSTFSGNAAGGGGGGNGQSGFFNSRTEWPVDSASGGNGGSGIGGALCAGGRASAVNSTFCGNTGVGGAGGRGGPAWSGTVYVDGRPEPVGGPAGADGIAGYGGGSGCGGLCLTNCTLAFNMAAPGTNGNPQWVEEDLGVLGPGAVNTLVATHASATNASGPVTVAGSNLGSDAATLKLGPLADNGGPTLTMALLAGSPAIGAGESASAPPTDQRGFPRPSGSADIGAYQFNTPLMLRAAQPAGGGLDLSVFGSPSRICQLLASPDLVNWTAIATNSFGSIGFFLFHDPAGASQAQRFYRAVMP